MLQYQLPHSFPRCSLHFKFQWQSGKQLPRKIKESLICFFLAQREIILLSAKASEHQFLGRIQAKRPCEQTSGGRLEMKSAKNPGLRLKVISFRLALHFSDGFSEGHSLALSGTEVVGAFGECKLGWSSPLQPWQADCSRMLQLIKDTG